MTIQDMVIEDLEVSFVKVWRAMEDLSPGEVCYTDVCRCLSVFTNIPFEELFDRLIDVEAPDMGAAE